MKDILIIGGGAAGLAAAISASQADPSARITILEALDRVGKKILATGNGRCNLSNANITLEAYHSCEPRRLEALLTDMPTGAALNFFSSLGLLCATEEMGRIYPYCRQASMVLDVLLLALKRQGIHVECGQKVTALTYTGTRFTAHTEAGNRFCGDAVILTTGGKAAPKQGGLGTGYQLATSFGHRCLPLSPCLVALKSDHPALKGLKGVRAHCAVTLFSDGKQAGQERGELQFTDYGLSGIPAMQLSCRLQKGDCEASVDLLPHLSPDELTKLLFQRRAALGSEPLESGLLGLVHKKLLFAVFKSIQIGPLSRPMTSLSDKELRQLAAALKDWRFHITGTLGWEQAQVTRGGIPLSEVDHQFASLCQPGLYLAGELLDAAGDCGGYNLHWAWCSGITAGRAAASRG